MTSTQESKSSPVIECRNLTKQYRLGFALTRRVDALAGLNLSVNRGEVFGFLGPNGAGKSTTIKILTRLIKQSSGEASVLGRGPGDPSASRRVGFLPENPVFYDHLTGRELLEYYSRLLQLDKKVRAARIPELLDAVGLTRAADYQVRRYSKGMVERLGIAQALLQDPELVILDEPTSGLDPVGRREVRELIRSLRSGGRTVFFCTHIIPDVEAVCDRVGMVIGGRLTALGTVAELMGAEVASVEIVLSRVSDSLRAALSGAQLSIQEMGAQTVLTVPGATEIEALLRSSIEAGARVIRVAPTRYSLEDLFIREVRDSADRAAPER